MRVRRRIMRDHCKEAQWLAWNWNQCCFKNEAAESRTPPQSAIKRPPFYNPQGPLQYGVTNGDYVLRHGTGPDFLQNRYDSVTVTLLQALAKIMTQRHGIHVIPEPAYTEYYPVHQTSRIHPLKAQSHQLHPSLLENLEELTLGVTQFFTSLGCTKISHCYRESP